jgi:hypothetical protein
MAKKEATEQRDLITALAILGAAAIAAKAAQQGKK